MRTRTLLILAAICGLLILAAGSLKLLQVANDPAEVVTLALGEDSRIGDMTASVRSIDRVDDVVLVEVRLQGVDGADAEQGWRLWGDGAAEPLVPLVDGRNSCADATVSVDTALDCTLVFDSVDTLQSVIYLRAGEQRQWSEG